tara:strand:+ start:2029 stop:2427 length:399 start_codon:yes stop_codon:yes gene_type:complete
MNTELALLKFINHYVEHDPVKTGKRYNADQANLVETFGYNMVEKIHPKIFEENFNENQMKLKSKRINDEYVKIPLTPVQILHFKLLYYIVYTKKNYPTKLLKYNFSEDLSELLDNEDKIINLYKKLKTIISN